MVGGVGLWWVLEYGMEFGGEEVETGDGIPN